MGIRVLRNKACLLDHPDYIKYVLQGNHRNYMKSNNYEALRLVIGNGLLTSEGDDWLHQRRLMQPLFHRQRIREYGSLISQEADKTAARWEREFVGTGKACDTSQEMAYLTLRIVSRALFGTGVEHGMDQIIGAQSFLNSYVDSRMGGLNLPSSIPTPANRRYKRNLRDLDEVIWRLIEDRRKNSEPRDDLLSLLLEAEDEQTGQTMTERQLRDEVTTLLLAGNETTANALSWTWYLLHQHPQVEAKLHQELDQVLNGTLPSSEHEKELHYTEMVLQEAMRLYPPAWAISRQPISDDEIAGYSIPSGTTILMCPYVTHRNPGYWKDPDLFIPERFAEGPPNEYSYFPFGGGPRKCLGSGFAIMESKLVLASLAQQYRLKIIEDQSVRMNPLVTLRPRNGIMAEVLRR